MLVPKAVVDACQNLAQAAGINVVRRDGRWFVANDNIPHQTADAAWIHAAIRVIQPKRH